MLRWLGALVIATVIVGFGVLSGAGVALAANDHTVPPPDVFDDINPCTGDEVEITQTYTKAVFHLSEDAHGGFHFTGTFSGTIATEDGYSGRFTFWFGGNESSDFSHSVGTFTFSATLGNGTGQRVVVHELGHVTIVDGDIVVEIENSSLECKGKPA